MKTTVKKLLTLIMLIITFFIFSTQAHAAKDDSYQVELIIFEQLTLENWFEEKWPLIVNFTPRKNIITLKKNDGKKSYWSNLTIDEAANTKLLWQKIIASKSYRVLVSRSWIQPITDSKNSPYVSIKSIPIKLKSGIDGTFRLYKDRFFHINIDLIMSRVIPIVNRDKFADFMKIPIEVLPQRWNFKLSQSRKISTKELQYFDHPNFGVLVKITRIFDLE